MRGALWPGYGRAHARCGAYADVAWRGPLSRQEEARLPRGRAARARAARTWRTHVQRFVAHGADRARKEPVGAERRAPARAARPASGEYPLFSGEIRAPTDALAARAAAHCAPY